MEDYKGDKQAVIEAVCGFLRGVRDALDASSKSE